ncbi:hypothetical protein Tco_0812919 [Tanacetum coccineum]
MGSPGVGRTTITGLRACPEAPPVRPYLHTIWEQPLPAVVSPTADSPGYIPESDPEEENEEDPEEDPAYYPADIGDDDEEDEEEEHLAFVDSTVVALPAIDSCKLLDILDRPISLGALLWHHGCSEDTDRSEAESRGQPIVIVIGPIHHRLAVRVEREAWDWP